MDCPRKVIARYLSLVDNDEDGSFTVLPIMGTQLSLIVKSTVSCIDKGASMDIEFEDQIK